MPCMVFWYSVVAPTAFVAQVARAPALVRNVEKLAVRTKFWSIASTRAWASSTFFSWLGKRFLRGMVSISVMMPALEVLTSPMVRDRPTTRSCIMADCSLTAFASFSSCSKTLLKLSVADMICAGGELVGRSRINISRHSKSTSPSLAKEEARAENTLIWAFLSSKTWSWRARLPIKRSFSSRNRGVRSGLVNRSARLIAVSTFTSSHSPLLMRSTAKYQSRSKYLVLDD